jgi:TPR repeat protein
VQRQLLWSAVKKGNTDASVKLAELYIMGRGVEKSCDQAMVLLRSASAHNSARARGKLGAMYATGECVEQDRVQAYHWMSMALQSNPGSDWTARYRESIWDQMTAGEKMRAKRDR